MEKREALEAAREMYEGNFGNVPVIAEKVSTVTTLTRNRAKWLVEDAVVEFLADLMMDYSDGN